MPYRRPLLTLGVALLSAFNWPTEALATRHKLSPFARATATPTRTPTHTPTPTPTATPAATATPTPAPTGWTTEDIRAEFPYSAPWGNGTTLDWPYGGFAIARDGQTLFAAAIQDITDYDAVNDTPFIVAIRSNGVWTHQRIFPGDGVRRCYFHILPTTGNGAYVVATKACKYEEMGWAGGSNFVWFAVDAYYSPDWTSIAPTTIHVGSVSPQAGGTVCYWARSARLTADGAVHILSAYETDSPVATNLARYARILGTTVTHEGTATAMTGYGAVPNYAVYLTNGSSLYTISSYGDGTLWLFQCDANGIPQPGPTPLAGGHTYGPFWATTPSSGSPESSQIDVCYANCATDETQLQCTRIALGTTPTVVFNELVAGGQGAGDAGNNWGPHKLRIARTPGSTLYVVGVTNANINPSGTQYHNAVVYRRDGPNVWTQVHSENGGREPGNLAVSGEHTLYLHDWPNGYPNVSTGTV